MKAYIDTDELLTLGIKLALTTFAIILSYEKGFRDKLKSEKNTNFFIRNIQNSLISTVAIALLFGIIGLLNDNLTIFIIIPILLFFSYMKGSMKDFSKE